MPSVPLKKKPPLTQPPEVKAVGGAFCGGNVSKKRVILLKGGNHGGMVDYNVQTSASHAGVFGSGRGFVRFGEFPRWDGLNGESPCGRGVGGEGAIAHLPVQIGGRSCCRGGGGGDFC